MKSAVIMNILPSSMVWFYGVSTIIGYLMPHPVNSYVLDIYDCKHKSTKLNGFKYCNVSLTIQLNINHLFTHS